ncbi:nitrous oxide reductase family maturation protein NosD [Virgibacillus byunsanensis]|uniref:Nitrous oxide reductase family maturation protein NosD n=1 Tax=Virgibacillus byunsanensis TaxID=570945 RepID=A0ABW3LQ52_9BACI
MNRKFAAVLIGLFMFVLFPVSINAEDAPSIKQLLEEASKGDVIQLKNHVYEEDVLINKKVTIKGADETVIKGTGNGDVITLLQDGVTLENLTITNSGSILDYDYAGIKIHSDENNVIDNKIENSLHGIYLNKSIENNLIGNTITGNQTINQSRRGNGIHLFHSSRNKIKQNMINAARDGIYFSFAEHNQIDRNHITNNRYGLHYMYSDYNDFFQNQFYENVGGAAIMYSDYITLKENKFYDHHGLQSFGILLQTSNDIELTNNQIHFNQKGIFMDQSNRNVIKKNQITNNRIGLDIWASSVDNTFTNNLISQNNLTYSSNGGQDRNAWSENGIGNAWSDHNVVDLDQNGIADNPFIYAPSYGKVLSDQPLGALFLDSPALRIYEKWNQLVGVEDGKLKDPNPIHVKQKTLSSFLYELLIILITAGCLGVLYKRFKHV